MKHLIRISIILLILIYPSCKKIQNTKFEIPNSQVFIDTNDVYNKKYRKFVGKLEKEDLQKLLKDSTKKLFRERILINNEKELVEIVEPILFRIYGKEKIINERPYDFYRFGDYWILTGTLPKESLGGTFNIKINRKTCKVIGISHGK
jgi:hypothetical protein